MTVELPSHLRRGRRAGRRDRQTLKQDIVAWVAQGPISDRTQEHLSPGDKGIILFHKMLDENMRTVARGEDPMGVIRDPAKNEPLIPIKRSREHDRKFSIRDDMEVRLWQTPA